MDEKNDFIQIVIVGTLVVLLLTIFIVIFIVQQLRHKQKSLLEKQQLLSQFQQAILRTQLEIQEQTLKTISGEIHDNIGQALSLAKLNLNTLPLLADETVRKKVETAREQVKKAINDLRDLSKSLHGDKIAEIGLEQAIAGQLKIIENSGQFTTSLSINGDSKILEAKQEMVLFRMIQEILNNAVKHSKATQISVIISYTTVGIGISISDNGIGFDSEKLDATQTGIGLTNVYSRAALINAKVSVQSFLGTGAIISIEALYQ